MESRVQIVFVIAFIIIPGSGCRMLPFSIQTANHIPVVGEDYQLTCSFFPSSTNEWIVWKNSRDVELGVCYYSPMSGCSDYVENPLKYSVIWNISSVTLEIKNLTLDDSDVYNCTVMTEKGVQGSQYIATRRIQVLQPVFPAQITLSSSGKVLQYGMGPIHIFVNENSSTSITCTTVASRPPAKISWALNTMGSSFLSTSPIVLTNVLDSSVYDTASTVQLFPTRHLHKKRVGCSASVGTFHGLREAILIVDGPPSNLQIIVPDSLRHGVQAIATCIATNGYPAPVIHWYIGSRNVTEKSQIQFSINANDRYDAESTLTYMPERTDHGKRILCEARHSKSQFAPRNTSKILHISYKPDVSISSQRIVSDDQINFNFIVTCTSIANPPAQNFSWLCNGTVLQNNTRNIRLHQTIQGHGTLSYSKMTILQTGDHCEYSCVASTAQGLGKAVLNSTFPLIPDPPSVFVVDRNQTTSSTLFVSWQPGFDGGLPQTFSLEYCLNDTQGQDGGCEFITNLTGTTYILTGLKPFTWYRFILWAVNNAGNSSTIEKETSTAPLPPENYGINITLYRKKHILAFLKENQSFTALCLIIRHAQPGEFCASVNKTECIEPGTNVTFQSENDPVVMTYGRGLCSEPAKQIEKPVEKEPRKSQHFMTIVVGVTASAGVILLISLGLMHFYGLLCCMKRKKAGSEAASAAKTVPTGKTSKSTSEQIQDYAEIEPTQEPQYQPLRSPKASTSFYMDMKPISSTHSTTLGFKPSGSGSSNDEYVSPSDTGQEQEPMYASADDPKYINTVARITADVEQLPTQI